MSNIAGMVVLGYNQHLYPRDDLMLPRLLYPQCQCHLEAGCLLHRLFCLRKYMCVILLLFKR